MAVASCRIDTEPIIHFQINLEWSGQRHNSYLSCIVAIAI